MEPIFDTVRGSHGTAEPIELPTDDPKAATTVAAWLLTCPGRHPAWAQWMLAVVSLADVEGVPPAVITVPGATHELLVIALEPQLSVDPLARPWTPGDYTAWRHLTPINIVQQVTSTDDAMRDLASLLAQAVVHGVADPETADAPEATRAYWRQMIHNTLAHLNGEHDHPEG